MRNILLSIAIIDLLLVAAQQDLTDVDTQIDLEEDTGHPIIVSEKVKKMLQDYKRDKIPTKDNSKAFKMRMQIYVLKIWIDEKSQMMEVDGTMPMMWTDEYLSWTPTAELQSTKEIWLPCTNVWYPRFRLFATLPHYSFKAEEMRGESNSMANSYDTSCGIKQTGEVSAYPRFFWKFPCRLDVSLYPNDEHSCVLRIVNDLYTFGKLSVSWNSRPQFSNVETKHMHDPSQTSGFEIYNMTFSQAWIANETQTTDQPTGELAEQAKQIMEMRISFRRKAPTHAYIALLPLFVGSLLTTVSLLHPSPSYAMMIAFCTFPFYIISVHDFIDTLPMSLASPPPIVVYYGICLTLSMMTALFNLIVLVVVGQSPTKETKSFLIENRFNCFMFIGFLMFLGLLLCVF